ncbi:MAG: hypothetical protein K0R00_35 [Herbinix sp.]|nr:hypothetical protein [Herbinix sp.]
MAIYEITITRTIEEKQKIYVESSTGVIHKVLSKQNNIDQSLESYVKNVGREIEILDKEKPKVRKLTMGSISHWCKRIGPGQYIWNDAPGR